MLALLFNQAWSKPILLDRVVAVVNDDIILKSELDYETALAEQELRTRNIDIADQDELQLKVLDRMVIETLQLQQIKQMGLKVSDEELLTQIQEIAEQNNLTIMALRDRLNYSAPNGFEDFRERIRKQMLFQKLREAEVLSKTQVTEDEINNFIQRQKLIENSDEYRLKHILVSLPESATPAQRDEARAQAESILQKLQQGEDFGQVAVRFSDGNKALQGGDLGWLTHDQIPTFFAKSVSRLKPGQISDIIRSPVGFHIIKLDGQRNQNSQLVKQYHVYRFILLSDDAKNAGQPSNTLISLANSIDSLEKFKQLNDQYSDIPASVNANGNLGWQTAREMPADYFTAIAPLEPGQTARPFATDEGWVILYLDGIREQDKALDDKRQHAMETLRMKKANESFEIWLRRLRDEALVDIRYRDPEIMNPQPTHSEGDPQITGD
ncbi:MAG: peptidylprolyl isomerase [Hydrogenovibrio sp.]